MQDNRLLGIGCMLAAMAMISVQEAFAKYLGQTMPIPQVVWARYIGHLSLMVVWLWPKHSSSLLRANRPFMQIGRSLLLLIDTSLAFWGLTMIGLAELTAIFFTVPCWLRPWRFLFSKSGSAFDRSLQSWSGFRAHW